MFSSASSFNQPVEAWNVGRVISMNVRRRPASYGHRAPAHTQLLKGSGLKSRVRVLAWRRRCSMARAPSTSLWLHGTSAWSPTCGCAAALRQGNSAPAHTQLLSGAATSHVPVLAWRRACSTPRAPSTSPWKLGTSARSRPCLCAAALPQGHRAPAHTAHTPLWGPQTVCACAGAAQSMFSWASAFNQPVEAWDVGQVTSMHVRRRPASG